ncbi:MAG: hypothetical protein M9921_08945 [Fimbriimonadaceae bacterium]|nr:hypothetical protein [Fimbriimonadaceae bacterium]
MLQLKRVNPPVSIDSPEYGRLELGGEVWLAQAIPATVAAIQCVAEWVDLLEVANSQWIVFDHSWVLPKEEVLIRMQTAQNLLAPIQSLRLLLRDLEVDAKKVGVPTRVLAETLDSLVVRLSKR